MTDDKPQESGLPTPESQDESEQPEDLKPIEDTEPDISRVPKDLQVISRQFMGLISGQISSPWMKNITSEHITKIIDSIDRSDVRSQDDNKSKRRYALVYTLLGIGLILFFTFMLLEKDPGLLRSILVVLVTAGGTLLAGIGIGRRMRS